MRINRGLLVLSAVTLLMGASGFMAPNKVAANQSDLVAQDSSQPNSKPEGARRRGGRGFAAISGLTDAQKDQLRQIHESTRQQMDAILTAEQREQMRTAREQRQRPSINLTEDQKTRMRTIREDAKKRMEAVLTPEQRQQLEQMRQQRPQRPQQPQS
ncbi:Spy/CpxP family protein refolding chaperone [Planktothrix sp. FACHB-1355]|uniref:Spy/CpxP family protein refolding chaperone n=1 Tax=Aerosakkonema funiforme FACHB-1375 TaxID=2949571 RepID=A0A926ZK45_9CYAN|nr:MULTISPECIES: Spy/CpxP family protein refolding chaperone [Oscillatoriales]MBD2185032.1 Spy/CpxP family protein refolding chaperone [Aerosakkonema funiforme FACHB-1375]MBD3558722.1 Spy/CpxP family protein refolding chaperone [Planktothrix sp. FACHB-1355]